MFVWHAMRTAAIQRHLIVWHIAGGRLEAWPAHMAMIRAFYGY